MSTFVIVGGSYAAVQAAISARKHGYDGRIVLFSKEKELPYQRPPLSKTYLTTDLPSSRLLLRAESFYEQHRIELALGETVDRLDLSNQRVFAGSKASLPYQNLLLATGASAIQLPWQSPKVEGVFSLRDLSDAKILKDYVSRAKRAVIVGGGFIGLEVASSLVAKGIDTTVIGISSRLASRVLSPFLSDYLKCEHEQRGMHFRLNSQVVGLKHDGRVRAAQLDDGTELEADLIVVGVGACPNTQLLSDYGHDDITRGIRVDKNAKTIIPGLYAAGDCVQTEVNLGSERSWVRLESVNAANELGKASGASVAGHSEHFVTAPWFWSDQFDLKLQMVGLALPTDKLVLRGDPESRRFSTYHIRPTGEIGAVQSVNRPAEHMLARRLVNKQVRIEPSVLEDESVNLKDFLVE